MLNRRRQLLRFTFGLSFLFGIMAASVMSGAAGSRTEVVEIEDECDPVTFNAVFGPGTCVGDGNVTVDDLIAELTEHQEHGAWRFHPDELRIKRGERIVATNVGGEVHTFTPVAAFGGGFVPELNELSGTPDPAPECLNAEHPEALNFVVPGGTTTNLVNGLRPGFYRFQCCIHPWMTTELTIRRTN